MAARKNTGKKKIDEDFLKKMYGKRGLSTVEIAKELGVSSATVQRRLLEYNISKSSIDTNDQEYSSLEKRTLNEITKAGYTPQELKEFIQGMQKQKSNTINDYVIGKEHSKFILFGDQHIGNINYDKGLMKLLAKTAKKEKVDFVACTGDIFDGWYQNRPSSIFEQNAIGFDNQMKLAVEELGQLEVPLAFITGNHSYNTFVRGAGVEAGPYLEDKLKTKGLEAKYLGNAEGDIYINNTLVRLLHPDGGTAYALSYRPQKIIEALESGKKPQVLGIGHFHKAEYLFYRNVHALQSATLCGQTKYMKGKGIAAMKGFWVIDLYTKKNGQVDAIIPKLIPAYK